MPGATALDRLIVAAVALLLAAFAFGALSVLVSPALADDAVGKRDDGGAELVAADDDDDDDDDTGTNDTFTTRTGKSNGNSKTGNSKSGDTFTTRTGKSNGNSKTGNSN